MSYTVKSPLTKTSGHYTAQQLYAAFEPMIPADQREAARRLLDRIVVLCKALDLDEVIVAAIVWIETGAPNTGLPFRSEWWRNGYNAGNLGITGDPAQNAAAQKWASPEDAANGLMAHVVAYAYGKGWQGVWDVNDLGDPKVWDKRFDLVLREYGGARLNSLEALNGKWAWDVDGAYDRKLAERANKLESLMDDPPVDIPTTPEEPVFATWRQQFDTMFGPGKWSITQGWAVDSGAADYSYGAGHGLNGHQHTGLDVGLAYGTKMYAPAAATVVCGGTGVGAGAHGLSCDAFNDWGDGDGSGAKKGVGRIELLFDTGESLIFGHSRTSTVKPGDRVTRGQLIGTSGGMNGAHAHLEARRFAGGTYQLFDPKELLESLPIGATQPVPEEPTVALPIRQMMIPRGNGNRPGSKLNPAPLWITIHETANPSPGADAEMHAKFVQNGGGSEGVSFHGTVDDHEAIQMLPADEVGYHAGDGCNSRVDDIGCFQSFAIETCVNAGSNWSATKRNLVDFCAAIITGDPRIDFAGRKGQFSVDRIAQHNKWSGKNCPAKIRAEGSWNSLLAQIRARVAEIEGGTTPAPDPDPVPTEPDIVPGVDWGIAKRAFDNADLPGYVLTKGGPLSTAYIERVKQTGQLPKLTDRWPYGDGRVYYRFSNGDVALFTESDKKIRWIEEEAA